MLGVCGLLALGTGAAASPAYKDLSSASAKAGQAADGTARGRGTSIEKRGPVVQESTHAVSGNARGVNRRTAAVADAPHRDTVKSSHAAGPPARSNADRLRSLPGMKVREQVTPLFRRSIGSRTAATGHLPASVRGQPNPQGLPRPAATGAARVPTSPKAARGAMVGGPRAAGPGRLGGPATARTANYAAIDGAQVQRKF